MKNLLTILAALTLFGCSSGNTGSSTTPMAYITGESGISVCDIKSNFDFTNCRNALQNSSQIKQSNIIAVSVNPKIKTVAYLSDPVESTVYQCHINLYESDAGQLHDCNIVQALINYDIKGDPINHIESYVFSIIDTPRAVTFNSDGNVAYIANDSDESPAVTICNIENQTGIFTSCTKNVTNVVNVANNHGITSTAYNPINRQLLLSIWLTQPAICTTGFNTTITNCNAIDTGIGYKYWATTQVAVGATGEYAYFANYVAQFIAICHINQTDGNLENCQNSIDIDGYISGINSITITANNKIAYVSNYEKNKISICAINESGMFDKCEALPGQYNKTTYISLVNN